MKFMEYMKTGSAVLSLNVVLAVTTITCEPAGGGSGGADTGSDTGTDVGEVGVAGAYMIVDTNQSACYDAVDEIACPVEGAAFSEQDAHHPGAQPDYTDNGDGTITDNVTGLMWRQDPGDKMSWDDAVAGAATFDLAGYDDWRLPTIKELYSLIDFTGNANMTIETATPYIDTDYFVFEYGDESAGERIIDAQYWSATEYVSTTMGGNETVFGVNFADGRIKGYPKYDPRTLSGKLMFVLYVRGAPDYGKNLFSTSAITVEDQATGLTWTRYDSGAVGAGIDGDGAVTWEEALELCQSLDFDGRDDWRLPNAKELQSIVDYGRSPATTDSPAIDPVFDVTPIIDEGGELDYPFYWASTTHVEHDTGSHGAYVAFGEALGFLEQPPGSGNYALMDVHGAGAQRSDPKTGNPDDYPYGFGPQGDVRRIYNYARCVRDTN